MKTKQIKGAVDILLVTGLPELPPNVILKMLKNQRPEMKNENWQFHCRLSEMTEEQAAVMVKTCMNVGWFDYRNKDNGTCRGLDTATEAVESLLEANGVLKENPHDNTPLPDHRAKEDYWKGFDKWDKAEANVFPPETTLVFIKTQ